MNLKSILTFSILLFVFQLALSQNRSLAVDTTVVTQDKVTVNGTLINYTVTTGTQPLWDEAGKPIASLHYTYYTRNNEQNKEHRPLVISFNGGPGSASVWMHLAYTGPRILNIDDEGYPVQPYGFKENPYSILDVADIVYVNPVNTGYSRMIPADGDGVDRKQFFGINADITYLAEWLNTFVTRNNRWLSPKYLIGESYGGVRVAGLSLALQNRHWMYLNGVIMVSPADYKILRSDNLESQALNLPYYAATAWFHKQLAPQLQQKDLYDILPEVEDFTINELMPAIAKGGFLEETERKAITQKVAFYSGLTEKEILQHNLVVPTSYFWKALLRDKSGKTIGRLDSRYLGIDKMEAGTSPDYSAELTSWLHSFTPAINHYFQNDLGFKTDIKYNMFGNVRPWDMENDNTRDDLRQAMAQNPYLNVLFQSGYYDGATTYFHAKYTMWQMDPSGKLKHRLDFKGYRSGHMMYLRREDLKKSNDDLREFILKTSKKGAVAKYE